MNLQNFSGSLIVRERVAVTDVVATIKLVSRDGEVLAATAIEADGVPVEFSLAVDPEVRTDSKPPSIWAFVRSAAGAWGTLELVRVKPGEPTEVVLSRVES